jgi:hypothetical protein
MRRQIAIAIGIAFLFVSYMNADCLQYEPATVVLCGVIKQKTFPGLPNYESIAKGDHADKGLYLQLKNPICVQPTKGSDIDDVETKYIKLLQLGLSDDMHSNVKKLIGKMVCVEGTLFHAQTMHHHTEVLIEVKNVKKVA